MAQAGLVLDRDQFNCSVCLDVLRNPVSIPCGHSYCLDCIQNYWDQDDFLGSFVCPQCRHSFNPRPVLARNTMLADLVDKFKKTGLQEVATTTKTQLVNPCFAEADDVECDVCAGRKNKALKSCLVCLASYCEVHLQPHYESAAFKKHKLVSASKKFQETICGRHDKLLEVYCRTDKQCICYLCLTDEHKGHDTVLAEAEIQYKQGQLADMKQTSHLRIHQREKGAQEIRQAIFSFSRSARVSAAESDAVFTDLIRSIELKRFEVRELMNAQEKAAVSWAEQLLEKIEKEIAELKKNEAELDKLAHTEEHVRFLQSCQSLHAPPVLSALPSVTVDPNLAFVPVMTAVTDFKGLLQEVCQEGFVSIYEKVMDIVIVGTPNPAGQLDTVQLSDDEPAVQMEATLMIPPAGLDQSPVIPPVGLDQSPVIPQPSFDQSPINPLNPFLPPGPTFAFSPFGTKHSSGSRQRHLQRRTHPRRK